MRHLVPLLVSAIFCESFLVSQAARADSISITVSEVKVYAKPDVKSEIITTLFKGDSVPVSKNPIPNFRKVLITDGANKKIGYIRIADLQGAGLKPPVTAASKNRKVVRRVVTRNMHRRYAAGLSVGVNYQYQNSRNYTDSNGGNATIGALSGSNLEFAGFFDFPFSYNFKLHTYVAMKSVNVTGTATYQLGTVPAVPESTLLNETFLSVGALAEIYPSSRSNWWWGLGLQVDHGMNGSLTFGSYPATALQGSDLPNFVLGQAAIGYDFRLGGNVFLVPDLKIGGVLNALPIILEADGELNFAYGF